MICIHGDNFIKEKNCLYEAYITYIYFNRIPLMQTSAPDTKTHYLILDGLRGVAAILVVLFHIMEVHFSSHATHPIHHGYMAVDFFFLLSGFVIGYAYDDRWDHMSIWDFFKIRLIRLHPMVILAAVLGAICFWIDPYKSNQPGANAIRLIEVMLISFTVFPSPDIRGWGESHCLNGPAWSLFQEYIANILYAIFNKKLTKMVLWVLVIICGIALAGVTIKRGDIGAGWGYHNMWIASVRVMFSFFAGLLLFRSNKLIRIPGAFAICSLALIAIIIMPYFRYNGLYEALCIIIAFPVLVAAGAGGEIKGAAAKICKFIGDMSYPIYITHYTAVYAYKSWVWNEKPSPSLYIPIAICLFTFMTLTAYASQKLYDAPVRSWLRKKLLKPQSKNSVAATFINQVTPK